MSIWGVSMKSAGAHFQPKTHLYPYLVYLLLRIKTKRDKGNAPLIENACQAITGTVFGQGEQGRL